MKTAVLVIAGLALTYYWNLNLIVMNGATLPLSGPAVIAGTLLLLWAAVRIVRAVVAAVRRGR